jgi:hypothetical protein
MDEKTVKKKIGVIDYGFPHGNDLVGYLLLVLSFIVAVIVGSMDVVIYLWASIFNHGFGLWLGSALMFIEPKGIELIVSGVTVCTFLLIRKRSSRTTRLLACIAISILITAGVFFVASGVAIRI